MKNLPLLLVTLVGTFALVIGVAIIFSQKATQSQTVDQAVLAGDQSNKSGPAEPKVTIVEFSDFQCPGCAAVYPLVNQVKNAYPTQVSVIYRHFPLTAIHPYAQISAQASEVAAESGKFWEMHDRLFEEQAVWSTLKSEEAVIEKLAEYAQELGIDKKSFMERIVSDKVKTAVAEDATAAVRIGVDATPTLYINGQKVTAPQQLNQLVVDLLKTE